MANDDNQLRAERAGRNQALFREVNEQIAQVYRAQESPTDFLQFVCECVQSECHERISMTLAEYERVRAHPRRFLVKPEHVDQRIERVVAEAGNRYVVVEKLGEAGEVAESEANRR